MGSCASRKRSDRLQMIVKSLVDLITSLLVTAIVILLAGWACSTIREKDSESGLKHLRFLAAPWSCAADVNAARHPAVRS